MLALKELASDSWLCASFCHYFCVNGCGCVLTWQRLFLIIWNWSINFLCRGRISGCTSFSCTARPTPRMWTCGISAVSVQKRAFVLSHFVHTLRYWKENFWLDYSEIRQICYCYIMTLCDLAKWILVTFVNIFQVPTWLTESLWWKQRITCSCIRSLSCVIFSVSSGWLVMYSLSKKAWWCRKKQHCYE